MPLHSGVCAILCKRNLWKINQKLKRPVTYKGLLEKEWKEGEIGIGQEDESVKLIGLYFFVALTLRTIQKHTMFYIFK